MLFNVSDPGASASAAQLAAARAAQAHERAEHIAARVKALHDPDDRATVTADDRQHVACERAALARSHARDALERAALAHDRAADLHEALANPIDARHHRAEASAARERLA